MTAEHTMPLSSRHFVAVVALMSCAWCAMPVQAQSVAMTGGMGSKALLVVDGSPPKAVGVGDTFKGVKVISVNGDKTIVEMKGVRQTVLLGGAPVSVGGGGGGGSGTQIVLSAVSGGHFVSQGTINGKSTQFMVDTGATSIAMGMAEAQRMGIKYQDGERFHASTANGIVVGYGVKLASVRIQDVEIFNVDAAVVPQPMPYILLGNSFLSRFQMKRDNDTLTLTKRY
ncbi:retropepsin-like aspartic protease family protein [Aquabacterium sp.]|uniref:retropepsin-like aspartic protease family protein n=1 Tax=Aquabacterium sp. TaxID=1872578 RepID=UPI003D6D3099